MKKLTINFCLAILLIPGFLHTTHQTNISIPRKSKEIAIIKAVGGIILATTGSLYGFLVGPVLMYDMRDSSKGIIGSAAVSVVSLPIAYAGYKIAKKGIDELHEIAQYS